MRYYTDFIEAFLSYTSSVPAPERYLRWCAMSIIAGALERKVYAVAHGTQPTFPNMYIMLVGPPGLFKKSTSANAAMDILKHVDDLRLMSTQMTQASLIGQLRDAGAQRLHEHQGSQYANSSLFLYASEAAVTLREIGGSVIELLTTFWDSHAWSDQPVFTRETKTDGLVRIYNPCLNMLACSTPDWLLKSIGADEVAGGFASRVLFVVQRDRIPYRPSLLDADSQHALAREQFLLVQELRRIGQMRGRYQFTNSFKTLYNELAANQEDFMYDNRKDRLAGYHARKMSHVLKVSQILAASRSDELLLDQVHLQRAWDLVSELEPDMYHAFGHVSANQHVNAMQDIWNYVRTRESFTKKQLTAALWQIADEKTIVHCLSLLVTMGKLEPKLSAGLISYTVLDASAL